MQSNVFHIYLYLPGDHLNLSFLLFVAQQDVCSNVYVTLLGGGETCVRCQSVKVGEMASLCVTITGSSNWIIIEA